MTAAVTVVLSGIYVLNHRLGVGSVVRLDDGRSRGVGRGENRRGESEGVEVGSFGYWVEERR